MATVSIIVPNYNHALYLEKRITSILYQTYTDYELILMDDASTDESLTILNRYKAHPGIRIVTNSENSGSPFKQWNKGVPLAGGEFVWIAESDDFSEPCFLEKLTTILLDNPHVGLAYCQSSYVDGDDKIVGTPLCAHSRLNKQLWQEDFILSGKELLVSYMVIKNVIPNVSAVIFRKDVFQAVGGADESLAICGDWMLWARMLQISDVGYIAKPLNYFRVHHATVRSTLSRQQQIIECAKVQKFICKNSEVIQKTKRKAVIELLKYFWQKPERPCPGEFTVQGFAQIVSEVSQFSSSIQAGFFWIIGLLSLGMISLFGPSSVHFAQHVYKRWRS
jgi:glycosyltransferase involved in cell wall biosynthesis